MAEGYNYLENPSQTGQGGYSQQPAATAQMPARWSRGLERMPAWLQGEAGGVQSYMKGIYDEQDDPEGYIQQIVGGERSRNSNAGEDDATVLRRIATGGGTTTSQTGAGGQQTSTYTPPAMTPSPFIMPNGMVPPGVPYSPSTEFQGMQDQLMRSMLTQPVLSPEVIAQMNEQQKELALQRGGAGQGDMAQRFASMGRGGGGYAAGQQRRASDALTSQLLQSQRDVSINAANLNRQGFLDALSSSDSVLGGREGRGLNASRFAEGIREYDNDLLQRQSEFGANQDYRYADLNANLEQAFINAILRGGY
jgi:hypothetical protein